MSAPVKSSTIATAISCKLTRTNFLLWKAQVVPILRGVQLYGHLDGTTPAPAAEIANAPGKETTSASKGTPNPEYQTWMIQDQAIIGGLLSSVTEEVLPQLIRCISIAQELWTSLHTMFSAQHRGNSIQIRTQLSTTKKGDMSISEYYQKMTGFADTMANIGQPMNDDEIIGYILAGLGPSHSDIFTAITALSNERKVTLPEFYSYLIAHEAQCTAMGNTVEFTSSANSVNRQEHNTPRRNFNSNTGNQNGSGYHNSNNYQRGSYRGGGSRGRSRGRGRSNGGPRCQVCGIPGHTALTCRNRFNHAYQSDDYRSGNSVTTSGQHSDGGWFMDCGATDHLTNELDRLSTQERYTGKDQVQVANGAGHSHEENNPAR